jgi:energy-coupling factor transporter ATP-binding protein EcfA2
MSVERKANPFPGLRSFESGEGYLFFGCEEQTTEVARRLHHGRLVAVVGASGSGKSSLVHAGLVPYLKSARNSEAGPKWRVATFRPGENPVHRLALALNQPDVIGKVAQDAEEATRDATLLEVRLKRSGLGLVDVVRLAHLGPDQNLLIVLDQFEELFRFAAVADRQSDAAAFVKLVLEATRQIELPIYHVLTMRSDFIGDCARFRDLPEAVAGALYLIPRLTREQRRAAIENPVHVAGGAISQRLVNRVLNDVNDDPDQLPVMQHALMRTWEQWDQRRQRLLQGAAIDGTPPIDFDDYVKIGGTANALSNHAEEAYGELDEKSRIIARRMFQCLTEKGPDNREVRRPTRIGTIAEIVGVSVPEVINVVMEFRRPDRSFLTPPVVVALDERSVIDISHESLIRHWMRLSDWVEDESEWAKSYRHLAETAALHEQGKAGLWGDPDLTEYLKWKGTIGPTEAWAERYGGGFDTAIKFLEASRRARDAAVRVRRIALAAVAATILFVIIGLSALTTLAFIERNVAVQKEQDANEAREDVAQVARLSRQEFSETRQKEEDDLDDLLDFAPPTWSAYLHRKRAGVRSVGGRVGGPRDDIDAAMRANPGYLPALVTSADQYTLDGNADAAVRDSRAYLDVIKTNSAAYGNLLIGEAIRHNYSEAIQAIDEALANIQLPSREIESLVAPDVQRMTYNFRFSAEDSDVLIALRYIKAALYAMNGDDRFKTSFEEAGRSDADYPFSREAYLLALNWEWLIVRGQETYGAQNASQDSPTPELQDYGAYAIEGGLWDMVARTRPGYREWAIRSYEKFRDAYKNRPEDRYRTLAAWVGEQLTRKEPAVVRDDSTLERARDLALQADELQNGASSLSNIIQLSDAHEKLTQSLKLLQDKNKRAKIGRREQDLLIRLLVRRSELRLQGEDRGGARDDAREVAEINPNLAVAYRLLAAAAYPSDDKTRRENNERALALDPYDSKVLEDQADLVAPDNPQRALALLQKRQRVSSIWADDYLKMARLQSRLGQYAEALGNLDLAILTAPWRIRLRDEKREVELGSKVAKELADLHFSQGLHEAAAYEARVGADSAALQMYVRALRATSQLAQTNDDARFELASVIRGLSAFLTTRFSAADAEEFWRSLSQDPLLSPQDKQLATTEADRIGQQRR